MNMTARRLRVVLAVIMVSIIAAAVVGFAIAQKSLAEYANSISRLNADAQAGDQNIRTLQNIKTRLDQQKELVQRTRAIVGDSSSYADTVINDISQIASTSGVTVKSIGFTEATASAATPAASAPTAGTPTVAPQASSGVVKKTVSVSIQSPLSYTSLMTFLGKIESNELRMHPTKIAMTKDQGGNVAIQDLSIEVYVRQ